MTSYTKDVIKEFFSALAMIAFFAVLVLVAAMLSCVFAPAQTPFATSVNVNGTLTAKPNVPLYQVQLYGSSPYDIPQMDNNNTLTTTSAYNFQPNSATGSLLYFGSNFTSLAGLNPFGTTPTVSNGALVLSDPGTSPGLSNTGFELPVPNSDETIDATIVFIAGTPTSTSYGLTIAKRPNFIANEPGVTFHLVLDSGDTYPLLKFYNVSATSAPSFPTGLASFTFPGLISAGDLVRMTFSQRGTKITGTVEDYTNGLVFSGFIFNPLTTSQTFSLPGASFIRVGDVGGTYQILQFNVVSHQPHYPNVCVVGDSKTAGYVAGGLGARWANLLSPLGTVAVFAGPGDRTQDILTSIGQVVNAGCQQIILNAGRNDLANAVPSATWQANYSAIVTALKSKGAKVVHLLPIPETTQDQSALKAWIIATYPNDQKIDVTPTWSNSVDLGNDGTHPNAFGHVVIATAILNSGYFVRPQFPASFTPPAPQ